MTAKRTFTLALALFALLAVYGSGAFGGHGSWTHHDLHLNDPSPSTYSSYADVSASQAYDFGHARWHRYSSSGSTLLDSETVTCQGSESCGYRKTVTQNFAQQRYLLKAWVCARDGTHELSGTDIPYDPCAPRSLGVHMHQFYSN